MSARGLPFRCRVAGDRVHVREGGRPWRRLLPPGAAPRTPSSVGACASLLPACGERISRLEPVSRVAALAAHVAIDGAARALGRRSEDLVVFLWVTMTRGCESADRKFWATACDDGALASPQRFVKTLPSAVAGDVALALGLRGPSIVTAGGRAPPAGVPAAARDAADGAADLLLCLTVVEDEEDAQSPRILAVALPAGSHAAPGRRRATLRPMRPRGGGRRGGPTLGV